MYNEIAKSYNELHGEEQLKKLRIIKNNFDFKNKKILDVGCGTGLSKILDCEIFGIDPSKEMLEQAQYKTIVAKAESIPFANNYFDCVISVSAIHNFENFEKGLSEMIRVSKGPIIISVLKKSKDYEKILKFIKAKLKITKEIEEEHDLILFGQKLFI